MMKCGEGVTLHNSLGIDIMRAVVMLSRMSSILFCYSTRYRYQTVVYLKSVGKEIHETGCCWDRWDSDPI